MGYPSNLNTLGVPYLLGLHFRHVLVENPEVPGGHADVGAAVSAAVDGAILEKAAAAAAVGGADSEVEVREASVVRAVVGDFAGKVA